MKKLQTTGMQEVTLEAEPFPPYVTIKNIADDGMADGREVNADLMGHSGFHFDLQ